MEQKIVVKKSGIDKKGIFAASDIKKGEVILKWHPKVILKQDISKVAAKEKQYLAQIAEDKFYLMQPPERHMNHSCEPNSYTKNNSDIALRDIKEGEEITTDYGENDIEGFHCNCGTPSCRGHVGGKDV